MTTRMADALRIEQRGADYFDGYQLRFQRDLIAIHARNEHVGAPNVAYLESPTGTGKTDIMVMVGERENADRRARGESPALNLILVGRNNLAEQHRATIAALDGAGYADAAHWAVMTWQKYRSWQNRHARGERPIAAMRAADPRLFKPGHVFNDECHLGGSGKVVKAIREIRARVGSCRWTNVSATPWGVNEKALGPRAGNKTGMTQQEAFDKGILHAVELVRVDTGNAMTVLVPDVERRTGQRFERLLAMNAEDQGRLLAQAYGLDEGDLKRRDLERLVKYRIDAMIDLHLKELAKRGDPFDAVVLYAPGIRWADYAAERYETRWRQVFPDHAQARGVHPIAVSVHYKALERRQGGPFEGLTNNDVIEQFKCGDGPRMVGAVHSLREGFDYPALNTILDCSFSPDNVRNAVQKIGRLARHERDADGQIVARLPARYYYAVDAHELIGKRKAYRNIEGLLGAAIEGDNLSDDQRHFGALALADRALISAADQEDDQTTTDCAPVHVEREELPGGPVNVARTSMIRLVTAHGADRRTAVRVADLVARRGDKSRMYKEELLARMARGERQPRQRTKPETPAEKHESCLKQVLNDFVRPGNCLYDPQFVASAQAAIQESGALGWTALGFPSIFELQKIELLARIRRGDGQPRHNRADEKSAERGSSFTEGALYRALVAASHGRDDGFVREAKACLEAYGGRGWTLLGQDPLNPIEKKIEARKRELLDRARHGIEQPTHVARSQDPAQRHENSLRRTLNAAADPRNDRADPEFIRELKRLVLQGGGPAWPALDRQRSSDVKKSTLLKMIADGHPMPRVTSDDIVAGTQVSERSLYDGLKAYTSEAGGSYDPEFVAEAKRLLAISGTAGWYLLGQGRPTGKEETLKREVMARIQRGEAAPSMARGAPERDRLVRKMAQNMINPRKTSFDADSSIQAIRAVRAQGLSGWTMFGCPTDVEQRKERLLNQALAGEPAPGGRTGRMGGLGAEEARDSRAFISYVSGKMTPFDPVFRARIQRAVAESGAWGWDKAFGEIPPTGPKTQTLEARLLLSGEQVDPELMSAVAAVMDPEGEAFDPLVARRLYLIAPMRFAGLGLDGQLPAERELERIVDARVADDLARALGRLDGDDPDERKRIQVLWVQGALHAAYDPTVAAHETDALPEMNASAKRAMGPAEEVDHRGAEESADRRAAA